MATGIKYSAKFKLDSVKMVTEQNIAVEEVAKRRNIGKSTLSKWIRQYRNTGKIDLESMEVEKEVKPIDENSELVKKLKEKINELQADNKALTKTIAILSRNT